ncbi:MAG: hypothetical protein AAF478_02830 [Pseudomonadota bacterium]
MSAHNKESFIRRFRISDYAAIVLLLCLIPIGLFLGKWILLALAFIKFDLSKIGPALQYGDEIFDISSWRARLLLSDFWPLLGLISVVGFASLTVSLICALIGSSYHKLSKEKEASAEQLVQNIEAEITGYKPDFSLSSVHVRLTDAKEMGDENRYIAVMVTPRIWILAAIGFIWGLLIVLFLNG